MSASIVSLQRVSKSFGPIDVLHDITLEIRAGEVLCLVGTEGAGREAILAAAPDAITVSAVDVSRIEAVIVSAAVGVSISGTVSLSGVVAVTTAAVLLKA